MLDAGSLNPGYFENPTAYTYLVYAALRVTEGGGFLWRDVRRDRWPRFAADPTSAFETGRIITVTLCMLGRGGRVRASAGGCGAPAEGVAAAAVLAFAFLPVAYSRFALTDTGVLLPVAAAVYGAIRAQRGRAGCAGSRSPAPPSGWPSPSSTRRGSPGCPLLVAAGLRARRDRRARGRLRARHRRRRAGLLRHQPVLRLRRARRAHPAGRAERGGERAQARAGRPLRPQLLPGQPHLGPRAGARRSPPRSGVAWEWRRNRTRALLLARLPA